MWRRVRVRHPPRGYALGMRRVWLLVLLLGAPSCGGCGDDSAADAFFGADDSTRVRLPDEAAARLLGR